MAATDIETTPLLNSPAPRRHSDTHSGFDPDGDPENPLEWPLFFKWFIVVQLACMSFTVTFTCTSVLPIVDRIVSDLGGNADSESSSTGVLLVTIWELGEAFGPVLIAPLSEIFGRYPLINICNVLFVGSTTLSALAPAANIFIVSRMLTGASVATNVLNPAIVGDIFPPEQRGTAMSLMMFAPLFGGTIGPALSGLMAETSSWRLVTFVSVALAAVCELIIFMGLRETYPAAILRRRAARDREHLAVRDEDEDRKVEGKSLPLRTSIIRPAIVLLDSGVLVAMSVFGAITFTYFYTMAVSLPRILEGRYGYSAAQAGSAFLANGIGSLGGISICNMFLDRIYVKLREQNNGVGLPEHRLPVTLVGAVMLPLATVLYGWAAEYILPVWILLLSVIWVRVSLMLAFLPLMAYVVDACGVYSASALTGVIVMRCLAGASFPLVTVALVDSIGYGLGFTVLAAATLVLGAIPLLVMLRGPVWRRRSKYTLAPSL